MASSAKRAAGPLDSNEKAKKPSYEKKSNPWDSVPPTGSATLKSLKKYVYVDKTNLLGRVMTHPETYIFAPSMRRCGKSFTVMLLKAMASGESEALEGLDICGDNTTWELPPKKKYGVISIDFSLVDTSDSTGAPEARIAEFLRQNALYSGIAIPDGITSTTAVLQNWIEQLSNGRDDESVVVLIDEYDTLLTPFLTDPDKLERNSAAMKSIFVTLKALTQHMFKVFVTGGLKAGMSGLFSGGNNFYRLLDMDPEYSALFGFTKDEVSRTYGKQISEIFPDSSLEESLLRIENYYNGYRIHPNQEQTLFNPFSTVNYLRARALRRYWALTCSSGQLDGMLLRHGTEALRGCRVKWASLLRPVGKNAYSEEWVSILFQSGYLTILEVAENDDVILGPPNAEVTQYLTDEIPRLLEAKAVSQGLLANISDYARELSAFRFSEAADFLTKVMASLDYSLLNESEFAGWALHMLRSFGSGTVTPLFECVFTEISQRIDADQKGMNAKRLDGALVVKKNDVLSVIVVELEYEKTALEAYNQITDRGYVERCAKFLQDTLEISVAQDNWYSVGFNLTNNPKRIVSYSDGS